MKKPGADERKALGALNFYKNVFTDWCFISEQ